MEPSIDINGTSTHHIVLSDEAPGRTTRLGLILIDPSGKPDPRAAAEQSNPRTTLRVSSGSGGLADFEMPYTPIGMTTWVGGMGLDKFEEDSSRYADGNVADTSRGKIMPAGAETLLAVYTSAESVGVYSSTINESYGGWYEIVDGLNRTKYLDTSFVATASYTMRQLVFQGYYYSTPPMAGDTQLQVYLYSDDAGSPGSLMGSGVATVDASKAYSGTVGAMTVNMSGTNLAIVSGTRYHLVLAAKNIVWPPQITLQRGAQANAYLMKKNNSVDFTWASYGSATDTVLFQVNKSNLGQVYFFELGGILHSVTRADSGGVPTVSRCGITGVARTDNAADKTKLNTGLNLASINLAGKHVRIVAGAGVNETQPWRVITSNTTTGTNDTITVSPAWGTTHIASGSTGATVFAIQDYDVWTTCSMGANAPTKPITACKVVDDRVYFCQGQAADRGGAAVNVVSATMTPGLTAPTYACRDEGVERDLLDVYTGTDGIKYIVTTSNSSRLAYKSKTTDLLSVKTDLGGAMGIGARRITGLTVYGDPARPFVFLDNGFGSISSDVFGPIPSSEMESIRTAEMGGAAIQSDRFLIYSMGESVERYYDGSTDDIGPDRGLGLPAERKGNVAHIVGYPGGVIYAAIDAGVSGYSSILCYNKTGWCEVYRADFGSRIRRLFVQSIMGLPYQRLWFSLEDSQGWIPIAKNPLKATGFRFATDCSIVTSWIYSSYRDVKKFWNSLKLFAVNISSSKTITASYRTDESTDWTEFGTFTEGPSNEIELNPSPTNVSQDVTGTRLQIKLQLHTDDPLTPVYIEAGVLEIVTRIPAKRAWNITARISDLGADLTGDIEQVTDGGVEVAVVHDRIRDILADWNDSRKHPGRILATFHIPAWSQQKIFVEPPSIRILRYERDPNNPKSISLVASMTLVEG